MKRIIEPLMVAIIVGLLSGGLAAWRGGAVRDTQLLELQEAMKVNSAAHVRIDDKLQKMGEDLGFIKGRLCDADTALTARGAQK